MGSGAIGRVDSGVGISIVELTISLAPLDIDFFTGALATRVFFLGEVNCGIYGSLAGIRWALRGSTVRCLTSERFC